MPVRMICRLIQAFCLGTQSDEARKRVDAIVPPRHSTIINSHDPSTPRDSQHTLLVEQVLSPWSSCRTPKSPLPRTSTHVSQLSPSPPRRTARAACRPAQVSVVRERTRMRSRGLSQEEGGRVHSALGPRALRTRGRAFRPWEEETKGLGNGTGVSKQVRPM